MAVKKSTVALKTIEPGNKKSLRGESKLEVGDSGTKIYEGLIYEEYNTKLRGVEGIEIYNEMRKSDGTVRAAILACMLPILRARWYVASAAEDGEQDEVSEFISKALFELQSITWADILRQSLLSLPFGVMVFEKVFDIRNVDGVDRIIWDKFAPRMPWSIQAWQTEDKQSGIQQRTTDGKIASIPIEKLLIIVNEKEGDNWWGNSILRAPYKHWHIKNTLYKIDAIAAERQGLGIPYAELPAGFNATDQTRAETVLKNMRVNEQAFAVIPEGWTIGFMDMHANTTRDLDPAISHHDRQITKSVLAQFLELGANKGSGSRALSQDQSELFLQSLEAAAENVADQFNKYAIPQLVDLNFPGVEDYPELKFVGITRTDVKALADTYKVLTESEAIHADPADEQHFRELLKLPERSEDEISEDGEKKKEDPEAVDDALDEVGMSEHKKSIKKKIYPERKEVALAITEVTSTLSRGHQMALLKRSIANFSQFGSGHKHTALFSTIRGELNNQLTALRKVVLAEEADDFKSFRVLTLAEKKVDYKAIESALDRMEDKFDTDTQSLLKAEQIKFMQKLTKAVADDDKTAIKKVTFEAQKNYEKIIKDSMKDAYQYGKTNAALEIGKKTPANIKAVMDQIEIQAAAIADLHVAEITNAGKNALIDTLNKGESQTQALASADAVIAAKIAELTYNTSRIVMAGYVNHGRNSVFETYQEDIYALQRSELLDRRTCNYCLSADGRVIEKDDDFGKNTIFHSNCRGIWVSIMLDESELPTIGGIPASVRDRFGDAVNDLIQPREPVTGKNSAARKEVERRAKRKAQQ